MVKLIIIILNSVSWHMEVAHEVAGLHRGCNIGGKKFGRCKTGAFFIVQPWLSLISGLQNHHLDTPNMVELGSAGTKARSAKCGKRKGAQKLMRLLCSKIEIYPTTQYLEVTGAAISP